MPCPNSASQQNSKGPISRDRLAALLNEDLAREYQAIIAYTVYSRVLKGAQYMNIADQLDLHAKQELDHALTIARQVDYLGALPPSYLSQSARQITPMNCCASISRMKAKPSGITGSGCDSVRNWANLPWPNRYAPSW